MDSSAVREVDVNLSARLLKITGLFEDFVNLMKENQLEVKAFSSESIAQLRNFDDGKIEEIYNRFKLFHSICERAHRSRINIRDTRSFLNSALSSMGLRAPEVFLIIWRLMIWWSFMTFRAFKCSGTFVFLKLPATALEIY